MAAELGARLDREVSAGALVPAIERLAALGLVSGNGRPASPPEPGAATPNRRSVLFFTLRAIDPGRLLDRLYPYARPLFSRGALAVHAALLAAAAAVTVADLSKVTDQAGHLFTDGQPAKTLVIVYLVNTPFIFAHEFCHALVARHFGCRVREMGFLLIYFSPALYADVSEAWRLSRAKRMWVGFAGIALNLTVSAAALLLWFPLRGTLAGDVLFVLALSGALVCVVNLNPLIRLDGYYILADYLRIPNLRFRSFQLMRQLAHGRFGALRGVGRRERRIYLVYGIVGSLYSLALIGWSVIWLYMILGRNFGPTGQLAGAALVGVLMVGSRLAARRRVVAAP